MRGFLVRKKLLEVRKEFEEILSELENDTNFVWWKTQVPGLPLMSTDPKGPDKAIEKSNSGLDGESDDESKRTYLITEGSGSSDVDDNCEGDPLIKNPVPQDSSFERLNSASETYLKISTAELEGKTMVDANSRLKEHDDGERYDADEGLLPERPIPGASNPESVNCSSELHINYVFGLQNGTTSLQVEKPDTEASLFGGQNLERQNLFNANAELNFQHGSPVETSHHIREPHFPLNSTVNPGWQNEQEMRRSFGPPDSASEASLREYVSRTPHLREQALLSDTWLTDKSFGEMIYRCISLVPFPLHSQE